MSDLGYAVAPSVHALLAARHSVVGTAITATYMIYYNKTTGDLYEEITEFVVVEDHLSPHGEGDLPLTTNEVISTYNTSDEGGFIFISYKREAYGRPEAQGMLYFIYYELNQCPLQFSHQPLSNPPLSIVCALIRK